jgi:hypothetical protein
MQPDIDPYFERAELWEREQEDLDNKSDAERDFESLCTTMPTETENN